MTVTHKLKLDLVRRTVTPRIDVVHGDAGSRVLELSLQAQGEPWSFPEDAAVTIAYRKSDGTGGEYDRLPDGSMAWSGEGNVLRVILADQMMTAPGEVRMRITLTAGEKEVSTFPVRLVVDRKVEGLPASENYQNLSRIILTQTGPAEPGQFLRVAAVENGRITALEPVSLPDA